MIHIFEIIDKNKRKIYLTRERWKHITSPTSPHSYMTNYLESIKDVLISPNKIINSVNDNTKANYYKYNKKRKQHMKVIVKYLNGKGFVISAYFVRSII